MPLFTYRYWHPVYNQRQTLDCMAPDAEAALASALRFLQPMQERAQACGFSIRLPQSADEMHLEPVVTPDQVFVVSVQGQPTWRCIVGGVVHGDWQDRGSALAGMATEQRRAARRAA